MSEWISVKDKLPDIPEGEYSEEVLMLYESGKIIVTQFERRLRITRPGVQELIIEDYMGNPIEEFTHWMPLPKPPENK